MAQKETTMDLDLIHISLHDWQQKLNTMAEEMEGLADEQGFSQLLDVMGLVLDAANRIDEVRP
jgi:hypothetical protein